MKKSFKVLRITISFILAVILVSSLAFTGCDPRQPVVPVDSPTGGDETEGAPGDHTTVPSQSPYEGTPGEYTVSPGGSDPTGGQTSGASEDPSVIVSPTDTGDVSSSPSETASSPSPTDTDLKTPETVSPSDTYSPEPTQNVTEAPSETPSETGAGTETVLPEADLHFHMEIRDPDDPSNASYTGFDVYAPLKGLLGYRYAPSIIYYPDGSMDAWFATPGAAGEWDWFTYKHSSDGGKTWSSEKVVLQPTPDSMDFYSVCDPGAIYFGGYYYLGYTSTIISNAINNNVFVARSKNPDGPYEKWNGSGWGGDPQPIIYYNENADSWGAGEPSFVVLGDTLYMYYTWLCDTGEFKYVATADARDPDWPGTLEVQGRAFTNASGSDQVDVVYVEDCGLFLGVQTARRFTETSGIQLWESKDGIHFIKGEFFKNNVAKYCHNMGISKRPDGHIKTSDRLMIGYAYSGGGGDEYWGKWATRLAYISLSTYCSSTVAKESSSAKNILLADSFWGSDSTFTGLTVYDSSNSHAIKVNAGGTKRLSVKLVNANLKLSSASIKDVTFSGYDRSIISFSSDGTVKGLKAGQTFVKATCRGFSVTFKVIVYPKDFSYYDEDAAVSSVKAAFPQVTAYLGKTNGSNHKIQVRGIVELSDGRWGEAYNDSRAGAMIPSDKYPITYSSSDPSIASVNSKGIVTPKKTGTVTITGTIGGKTFESVVTVLEAPSRFNWSNSDYKW